MAVSAPTVAPLRPQSARVHFRLLLWARWRSYRNLLRKSSMQRAKLLTAVLAWVFAIVGGGGSALAFAALGYAAGSKGRGTLLAFGAFFVFLLWQLAPLLFEITSPTINFRDIARYPVAFRAFYLLHLAYGLLDPAVALGVVWMASMWVGLLLARPGLALRAIVPFALFAAFNLLANRLLLSVLERVLATRRGREIVFGSMMLIAIAAQIVMYGILPRFGAERVKALFSSLRPLLDYLPPLLLSGATVGKLTTALVHGGALLLYSVIAAVLLGWQLRATFSGETYSEARRVSGAVQFRPGWSLPFAGERMSAVIEKELRYLFRDQRTWMSAAMPIVFAFIFAISSGAATKMLSVGFKLHSTSPRMQVFFSAGAVLVLSYLAYDCFGFDADGFPRWVLLPLRARDVLLAKNLAVALVWAAVFVVVNVVLFASGNASAGLLAPTLLGVIYGALMTLAVGNQFSVRTPLKLEGASIKSNNMTPGMMLGNMLVVAMLIGSVWLTVAIGRWLVRPWLTPLGLIVLAGCAAALYFLSLNSAANYAERNAEKIAAELA